MPDALLPDADIELLATALADYTVAGVADRLGPVGHAALQRADLTGAARALRGAEDPLATLVRLFVLGQSVSEAAAVAALLPLPLDHAVAAGFAEIAAGEVRALLDVRPYGQDDADWWVVSDFGADVRAAGPLAGDHVLGVGAAALTLAAATPRHAVRRALDIGTGCGVQALHLGRHAGEVIATDVSARALRFAATTAALAGQRWGLREGSFLEPVAGERFDLVVANPPFVISPGAAGYDYRDSGLAGDAGCAQLVGGLPSVLAENGCAQLLANWIIPPDGAWQDRVAGWLRGRGCDAWVWQREVAELGEYVTMWLRDAGEQPGTPSWARQYESWLDWFQANGVVAVGMGLITMWRTDVAEPTIVLEDVPQQLEQPIGDELPRWRDRQRWLADHGDQQLLTAGLRPAAELVREHAALLGDTGWKTATIGLRQSHGMRWQLSADDAISSLVAGCDGARPLQVPISVLAASLDRGFDEVAEAVLPVVRQLVSRGFLEPPEERS